jgi:hypothetical protein
VKTCSIVFIRRIATLAALCLCLAPAMAQQTAAARIVQAANTFISSLDANQRQRVLYAFDDARQRARWSNLPVPMVPRGGISLREMTAVQRSAAMALVASALSARGLEKVQQIMQGDEELNNRGPGGGNGNPPSAGSPAPNGVNSPPGPMFGKDVYYISILGTPSENNPWMLQFGGHHLALNVTIAGDRGVLTPTLTGAQPALYTINGKIVRPLGKESDKAFALLQSLDDKQRGQAILSYRLADLVLGPGQDGKTIVPEGLKASALTEPQRVMLLDLIAEWADIAHESAAASRMAELGADINETWFAWSGPATVNPGSNITAYYRIQGPHLVIEYAPQTLGGDPSMHVHTMYRDPTNDYGKKLTAAQ